MQSPALSSSSVLLYGYRPSLALSLSLAALYSVLFAASSSFLVAAAARRRHRRRQPSQHQRARARAAAAWVPYTACLAVACLLELAGYICRVDGWEQPQMRPGGGGDGGGDAGWSDAFKAQLLLLVIAPVFVTAALALGLEQLTASLADEQPATAAEAAAGKKVDGKKHSRILLPLCALTLLIQAVGAALSGQAQSDKAFLVMQQQQTGSSGILAGSSSSISTGDMVVITGLVLQLNCLCVVGYRFLIVVWRQGSSRPGGAGMLRGMELENASSGWRRRLLQSQQGGRSHRDDQQEVVATPSMPEAPPPAVASQHTQVPYAIAEEQQDAQYVPERLPRPPSPPAQQRRRLGRGFLYAALVAATILVLARTAFRVVEFSQPSWRRSNTAAATATTATTTIPPATADTAATSELLFALFDATLAALAVLLLLAAHPLLTLVSDPSPPSGPAALQPYGPNGAGGAERYRRIQDWVETLTLSGGGGGGGGNDRGSSTVGGDGRSSTLGRSMSRRFSWVTSSRRTGRSGQHQQQQHNQEEGAGVAEPERAVIPMYR